MQNGKRYRQAAENLDREKLYQPGEAIHLLKEWPPAKFDETVEVSMRLGIDPRKADQMVRGTVSLPHGTGRSVRVAAFAVGDKAREAKEAGADVVGGEDLVQTVLGGTIEFDAAVATPDMKSSVAKGKYVKSLTISTTMGPGIRIDTNRLRDIETAAVPA